MWFRQNAFLRATRNTFHVVKNKQYPNQILRNFSDAAVPKELTILEILERTEAENPSSSNDKHPTWQSISVNDTVYAAACKMTETQVGSLIAMDENGVMGIVTERDILTRTPSDVILAEKASLFIKDIMTKHILCVEPSTTAIDALASMSKRNCRHIAVIHENTTPKFKKDRVPEEAMRAVLSIKDVGNAYSKYKKFAIDDANVLQNDSKVTTLTLLEKKRKEIGVILNSRDEDEVTITEVVEAMVHHKCGSVVMLNNNQEITGIFTERDYITKIVSKSLCPTKEFLNIHATRNVSCVSQTATVEHCFKRLEVGDFRHLPVYDNEKHCIGVLSIKDFVKEVSKDHETPGFWLFEYFKPKPKAKEVAKPDEKSPEQQVSEQSENEK